LTYGGRGADQRLDLVTTWRLRLAVARRCRHHPNIQETWRAQPFLPPLKTKQRFTFHIECHQTDTKQQAKGNNLRGAHE
jgi:hypothetical protein